jgi:hypothetical protein
MALLTDRTLAASSAITASTLIHIVDVNDFSQNPAGSSYKANLGQLSSFFSGSTFTGGSGNCITDFYVTNIHGCSPIHIQPTSPDDVYLVEGGGNVGIGLTSASTKLHVSGDTLVNSNNVMLSNSLTSIPVSNFKGFISYFDSVNSTGYYSLNQNVSGDSGTYLYNDSLANCQLFVGGSQSFKSGGPVVGSAFYQNKVILKGNTLSNGMVFNPSDSNSSSTFWWEFNGSIGMTLKGDGTNTGAYLGLALNPDGTEMPTSNIQIGGTGTTGTFQYKDGNQSNGYLLTSDSNGNATWEPFASSAFTGNTSATCITDLHVSNIHSCSPLYINPLSEGDIYVGSANTLTVDLTNERIGIGTSTPTAKLHIQGIDTSSSNYGLKVQGSGGTNNLLVRNDGIMTGDGNIGNSFQLGSSTPYIEGDLTVGRAERDTNTIFSIYGANYPTLKFDSVYTTKTFLTSGLGGQFLTLSDNVNPKFTWLSSTNIGINLPTSASSIDATLKVVGSDSSSSNYGLKVQNSGETDNFVVRNDGNVGIGTSTPTEKLDVSGNTIINGNLSVTGNTILSATTASTLNISSTPTTDTGTTANYLTRDGSTGEVKVKTIPGSTVYGLFAQTGDSVVVSGTTSETSIVGAGVGGLSVPANGFQVGDSFVAKLYGHITCVGTATIQIRIKSGSVLLADTGIITLDVTTNKHWNIEVNFTIRSLGNASVGSIVSAGLFSYIKNSGLNFEGTNFVFLNNTTFDTTILNTLDITAQWNTNNAGNSIYSDIFVLNKIY